MSPNGHGLAVLRLEESVAVGSHYGLCGATSSGRCFCFAYDHLKAIPIKLTGAKI
jgi:hypothetical protein